MVAHSGIAPLAILDPSTGHLSGGNVVEEVRFLRDLPEIFARTEALQSLDPDTVVYRVRAIKPVEEGTEGGLFFGTTTIEPGTVEGECFMTRGHFHARRETGEFYWGIEGEGLLLLMSEDRSYRLERVSRGSVHYIPGNTGHRLINTGAQALRVGACWHATSGHDHISIADDGFPVRVYRRPSGIEVLP